jgi:nitrite reductase (NO-forming)
MSEQRPAPADPYAALRARERSRRDGLAIGAVLVALVALLAAAVAVAISATDGDGAAASTAGPAPTATSAAVHLTDLAIGPKRIEVAPGATLHVANDGAIEHNLAVKGAHSATPVLAAGQRADLDLADLAPGAYTLVCELPGHEAAGMSAALQVGAASAPTASTPSAAAGSGGDAAIDLSASPGPEWKPFDPTLQPAGGATVHDIVLHATERQIEVAPGVVQEMWTFGDQVPGPVLRGRVGDVFNVTLVNDGKMGHSIDFHASEVAPNVEMATIASGESLVYRFRAEHAGIWMHHCGTAPALHHIGNGMYGAVVIDPPGLPAVDRELVVVQSELYLGPQGQPGDLAKMQAGAADAVVFNGYVNQYLAAPIRVEPGETVRIWVLDAGPNEDSSFHIVGTVFDTVYKEGAYLLRPDGSRGGSQALDLQPAQGGFVELTFDHPGLYPMVTHKFANVGKGALGTFQVGDVEGATSH